MCKYELAAKAHKNVYGVEVEVEEIKRQVQEIMREHNNWIDESAAFVKWLESLNLKDEFKKLKEEERMENAKKEVIERVNSKAGTLTIDEAVILADKYDELLIEEQVLGAKPLVYEIKTSKGVQYVLSWEGLTEAMLRQGNIKVIDVEFEEVAGKLIAKARVVDLKRNVEMLGVAEAYSNEKFKLTTLASKAIRNALRKVVSNVYQQQIIKEAKSVKSIIALTPSVVK